MIDAVLFMLWASAIVVDAPRLKSALYLVVLILGIAHVSYEKWEHDQDRDRRIGLIARFKSGWNVVSADEMKSEQVTFDVESLNNYTVTGFIRNSAPVDIDAVQMSATLNDCIDAASCEIVANAHVTLATSAPPDQFGYMKGHFVLEAPPTTARQRRWTYVLTHVHVR